MKRALVAVALTTVGMHVACGHEAPRPATTPPPPAPVASSAAPPAPSADALGPKPEVPAPPPFTPPAPVVYAAANGITVWLVERHALPIVAVTLAVPTGAAADPNGKGGLARITAGMLDEGAGKLGSLELAREIDTLGADLSTSSDADASYVSLVSLKRNLAKSFTLFGDVVARPRFDPKEWKRVHDLWENALKARAADPNATARVVFRRVVFGEGHPYAHPWDGTFDSAKAISLADVKRFYAEQWRPDRATIVVVGDVTKDELAPLLDGAFSSWKAPKTAPPPIVTPPAPSGPWPRAVMVDRPDAPQSVIATVRTGVSASDPNAPAIGRANMALGGSFTSRLNQDLREEHGWSYGARSVMSFSRGPGELVAYAAVRTDATADALKAMLFDVNVFARDGLTKDEVQKTRSQARGELVQAFEAAHGVSEKLASDAALGLGPDYEAKASAARDAATRDELNRLAAQYFDPSHAVVVVVGPKAQVAPAIAAAGLPQPEMRDADGNPIK